MARQPQGRREKDRMSDFIDLTGKTVLVTGGSRGIGEGIVRALVAQGAHVVLNYTRSKDRAEAIADELGRDRCLPIQANMDRWEDLDRLWAESVAWKGRIDVLVNNAAVREPIAMTADSASWNETWLYAFKVNLLATAHLSRHAVLHYQKMGGGSIIGISARIAVRGDKPEYFHDGASKGGMNSLLRGIARFYAKDNIQTYLICVGIVKTRQNQEMLKLYSFEEMLAEIPAGHFGEPEDVANVVVFCASGRAVYSSGTTIDVTGASFIH
jgi:NAD(P)-dependent dehydrogenase (short-subunit alcohol dehydrogenase family)